MSDTVRIAFDPALPIAAHASEIADLVRDHQVVVVAGETGSGKTTQLPKICLALGREAIAHTQPRRIAARSVAERLAEELDVPLGDVVGYRVRFTRQASLDTRVTVMTDGILLAEIGHDRSLDRYDTIIIDEAHERSLNIDFLLGYLKQLLPRRPDLKVIITSATIDTARFAAHFGDAPVIEVSGRSYPVETRYRPLEGGDDADQVAGICDAVTELLTEPSDGGPGDVLVFLSGEREIRDAAEGLAALGLPNTEVLPLYARLSAAEQHRVFQPHDRRRVVLATNVAETSLTVPGIRYVVDPGTARISRWSARSKVQRLPIEAVSQASANQRAGRCGRLAPGVCIRLYSEEDFQHRPEFTEPEILRTNLASVMLQMADADLGDIASFPFVEPPDRGQVTDGLRLLTELGAIEPGSAKGRSPRLTRVGRQVARLPVDPRLARMLVEAARLDCLREVLVIVAALAIPDVRERPAQQRDQADRMHRRFSHAEVQSAQQSSPAIGAAAGPARITAHTGWQGFTGARNRRKQAAPVQPGGDVYAIWRLWEHLRKARKNLGSSAFRRLCRDEFLNFLRVREWEDLVAQLREITKELDLPRNQHPAPVDHVLTAVLSGLLSHVGLAEVREPAPKAVPGQGRRPRRGPQEYLGARGIHFAINPGSALAASPPPLVMAVELVDTTRLWARTVAAIEASWLEQVGRHALTSTLSEPHWSTSRGAATATERVTLYGVPVVADRQVGVDRIDPAVARDLFIRKALVEGDWSSRHAFVARNAEVRAEAEDLAERSRRHDLLVDDRVLYAFYDHRIPGEVVSATSFDAWFRRQGDEHVLDLTVDDLMRPEAGAVDTSSFPDHWTTGSLDLPIDYVFDPGAGHDGVTVKVPLALLNQVDRATFSWQVPGLRHELATALIRALPKNLRTNFVPAPDRAREALRWLNERGPDRSRPFWLELGRALRALTGVTVPDDAWRPGEVPAHLQVAVTVTDQGRAVGQGKNVDALRTELAPQVSAKLTRATRDRAVTGATSWVFGTIPRQVQLPGGGGQAAVGYPALVDEGRAVGQVVCDSVQAQTRSHAHGLRRLLVLVNPDPTKWVVSHLGMDEKLALAASPYPTVPDLLADARLKAGDSLARERVGGAPSHERAGDLSSVRDQASFDALAVEVRQAQADRMRQVVSTAAAVFAEQARLEAVLGQLLGDLDAVRDVRRQVDNLVFERFISATPDPWYGHLPRYVQAARIRLEQLRANPARDASAMEMIDDAEDAFAALCDDQPPGPLAPAVEEIAFLIEELRVSLFAQSLRTSVPVSAKRIQTAIEKARATSQP